MLIFNKVLNDSVALLKSYDVHDLTALSTVMSFLTLIVVIIYTLASIAIWLQTKFQSELAVCPILIVGFKKDNSLFFIKNIGKGVALDIQISNFEMMFEDVEVNYVVKFDPVNVLEPDGEQLLFYKVYGNGKLMSDGGKTFLFAHFHPSEKGKRDYVLSFIYKNALGVAYYTRISTGKSGVKILETNKRTWILWHCYLVLDFFLNNFVKMKCLYARKFKYKLQEK